MAQKSFTAACREHFGFKDGQKLGDFANEIKALPHDDKLEIAQMLRDKGIDVADPVQAAA